MPGLEDAALRTGARVVQLVAGHWLATKKAENRRGAELTELLSLRFGGLSRRSRKDLERKLDELADAAGTRLQEIVEREFRDLPDNERVAALDAVADTLGEADLSDSTLLRNDLDAPNGTDHGGRFRRRYLELVAKHHDDLELIGVSVRNFRPRTTLSVAYLSLTVHQDHTDRRSLAKSRPEVEPDSDLRRDTSQRSMRVESALSNAKRALMRGEAGSGKSTLLRWIAVMAARRKFTGQLSAWNG